MHGSLSLRNGVLWIARCVRTARIRPFDLDGRALGPGLKIEGLGGSTGAQRTEIRSIAVDEDHRLWAADAASGTLRAFTVAGASVACIRSQGDPDSDRPGAWGDSAGIAVQGVEADLRLLVSRRGSRRHALMWIDPLGASEGALPHCLWPGGDPQGTFAGLAGVALSGRLIYACETGTGAVQVFRDGAFHYGIQLPSVASGLGRLRPRAVAPLADGRIVVACGGPDAPSGRSGGGAVLLIDASGSVVRIIAEAGPADGQVFEPQGIAVEEGGSERASRLAVLDMDAERVQVFTLDGRCSGRFVDLDGVARPAESEALRRKRRRSRRP